MTQPLTERLRAGKNPLLRASQYPLGATLQYQMSELSADVSEAADRIDALAELVEALERLRPLFVDMARADEAESKWAEDWKPTDLHNASHDVLELLAKLESSQ